jgi:mono/diheme cytochrome c family protein
MTIRTRLTGQITLPLLILISAAGCQQEKSVSFAQDVRPILDEHCIECHQPGGAGFEASGFSMESYQTLMKGTNNGPMIIAGDSLGSNLLVLMEGRADPSISMPHGRKVGASKAQIETIRSWIDQGAQDN